jgi:SnoaL-like domain
VAAFYEKLAASWSANDGAEFAAFFTEDGSLVNPFGQRADGRDALRTMYSEYFGGMLKGTTTSISLTHLRLIEPDHFGIVSGGLCAVNRCRVQSFHFRDIVGSGGPYGGPPERVQAADKLLLLALAQRNMEFPRSPQAPEEVETQGMFPR